MARRAIFGGFYAIFDEKLKKNRKTDNKQTQSRSTFLFK